jgi:phosphohistidine phosphatase
MVFLVHHAEAAEAVVDPQRGLTEDGRRHADRLARAAAARGITPVAIWHSGKLRARQTAAAFLLSCNPFAELSAIRGLQPADPPEWIRDVLRAEERDVMLVGHLPNLARVLELLIGAPLSFPAHGLVAVEWDGVRGREAWRLE